MILAAPSTETIAKEATDPVIACARCSHAITRPEARVSRGGSHVHTRLNPAGWVYEFGCFAEAPGCRVEREAVLEHTWFAGHAWRVALCASCGQQLGWRFEGELGVFFGLILERLVG